MNSSFVCIPVFRPRLGFNSTIRHAYHSSSWYIHSFGTLQEYKIWRRTVAINTPSPPTESFPTKSPWVKLSGRLPIQSYGYDSSHPWIKSLFEANPLKSKLLVGGLGVVHPGGPDGPVAQGRGLWHLSPSPKAGSEKGDPAKKNWRSL